MGKKQKKGQIGAFICGFIIFVIFIFPLYWMVVTALKTHLTKVSFSGNLNSASMKRKLAA